MLDEVFGSKTVSFIISSNSKKSFDGNQKTLHLTLIIEKSPRE